MFTATVVAAKALTVQSLVEALAAAGCACLSTSLETNGAFRFLFDGDPLAARAALETFEADVFVRAADAPFPKLFLADMDSTMIAVECIDELADYAGKKAEVAAITEQAMWGELNFDDALRARVKLLKGLDAAVLDRCYDQRVRLTPGATTLVRTLKARGCRTVLVTGGFTAFAERVAEAIGFDAVRANRLGVFAGKLDGTVKEPVLGGGAKLTAMRREGFGLDRAEMAAIGDGANDLPMIRHAGLGIAYHGKPDVVAAADAAVRYGDLTSVLHGLGVARGEWVTA